MAPWLKPAGYLWLSLHAVVDWASLFPRKFMDLHFGASMWIHFIFYTLAAFLGISAKTVFSFSHQAWFRARTCCTVYIAQPRKILLFLHFLFLFESFLQAMGSFHDTSSGLLGQNILSMDMKRCFVICLLWSWLPWVTQWICPSRPQRGQGMLFMPALRGNSKLCWIRKPLGYLPFPLTLEFFCHVLEQIFWGMQSLFQYIFSLYILRFLLLNKIKALI